MMLRSYLVDYGKENSMFQKSTEATMLLLLCISGLTSCSSVDSNMTQVLANRFQNEGENLIATGYADIDAQLGNAEQKRILAIRASKVDAYRSLSEQIYGLYIDSSTTLGDLVVQSDIVSTRVQGIIYGAKVESIRPLSDTTYEVTLSLSSSIVQNLKNLYAQVDF